MSYEASFEELKQGFGIGKNEKNTDGLEEVNKRLLLLEGEIDAILKSNYEDADKINADINTISLESSEFQKKINSLRNKDAGSIQMYQDIRKQYNQKLLGNILLAAIASYGGYIVFLTDIRMLVNSVNFL